jgi:capsular polysaccharide transport system permease protein
MEFTASRIDILQAQGRIILALMLRDIKTRFGGSELGFIIAIGWPLSHILIILVLYSALGRAVPFGESAAVWFASGIIPFMAFSYMSRFIAMGILTNRALLTFPVVKVTDVLFARAVVEVLSAGLVILILFVIFWSLDIDFMPRDVVQASLALLSMMFLGLGFGVVVAIIAGTFPMFVTIYALSMIIIWISSGIVFVPDSLPAVAQTALSYLPWVQGVEWMRSAYYDGYGSSILDRPYLVSFAAVTLFFGLALERLARGKILY